eukprot:CAMPEP_0198730836 /NCGR_PEP_ID=MMETSP1475-20131203/26614_1 /TAXON_ID= ORGANISM="Unidentified sp., Strain CCMP1999" /NCGR_SAMPLE_ID=MMETSP1475 /ASSEMBLY_ACC=CAM_ASM_001111 /LENGTH=830 /DNA_ID=CAMNT_0044493703 /DNA_START=24 /DNA_END=2516 /DNA_ORIENTATION=+
MASMDVDFSDILAQSQSLSSGLASASRIPRLERQLDQIDKESKRILSSRGRDVEPSDDEAVQLFAQYGFETDKLEKSLQSVALLDRLEPYESFDDTDLDSLIRHEHEMLILGAMEENREKILRESHQADVLAMDSDWELLKREIVTLKRPPATALRDEHTVERQRSIFASPFRLAQQARLSVDTQRARADVLYNDAVKKILQSMINGEQQIRVAKEFESVAIAEKRGTHIEESFRIVKHIAHEENPALAAPQNVSPTLPNTLRGVLNYLHAQFLERKIRQTIASRPYAARRGGEPNILSEVTAYLRVLFEHDIPETIRDGPTVNGQPFWAHIFFLLRCGRLSTAVDLAKQTYQASEEYKAKIGNFAFFIDEYGARSRRLLSSSTFSRLVEEYNVRVRQSPDPFQRASYFIIARVKDVQEDSFSMLAQDYDVLFNSVEDYLWLRLNTVRADDELVMLRSFESRHLSIDEVQSEVLNFGASHFDPSGNRPFLFAQVLLLTGLYEEALKHVAQSSSVDLSDSMHLAVALHYHALISEGDPPMEDDQNPSFASFPDFIWRYVKHFAKSFPREACAYIFLLEDHLWRSTLLRRLILETRAFEVILGHGTASIGVIDELWVCTGEPEENKRAFISSVADAAANNGDTDAALELYSRCDEQDKITETLLHSLSHELTSSKASPKRREILQKALRHSANISSSRNPVLQRSYDIMLQLYQFFDLKADKAYAQAWDTLRDMNILPTRDEQLIQKSVEWKVGSRDLADELTDRIGDILVAAMECLAETYTSEKRRSRTEGGVELRSDVKTSARVLVNFAGILQLPSDVSAKIIKLEVLMS